MSELISLIVPCYNEAQALPYFMEETARVTAQMSTVDFEIILVDDGSKDRTLELMREYAQKDDRVRYISFSRNFGKESAVYAGLEHAKGDYVAMMDADLQDPPSLLPTLYRAVKEEGYDSAATRRVTRKGEPPIRSFFARLFYKLINKMTNIEIVDGARDFRLMNRKFVDALLSLKEYNRFSKGLFGWVGFKTKWIEFENVERVAGETKWSFWKLFKYSIEGFSAFTTMPLVLSCFIGAAFAGIAGIGLLVMLICALCGAAVTSGWVIAAVIMFFSGLQLFFIGVAGQYLAKMYLEIKNRPVYLIGETNIR